MSVTAPIYWNKTGVKFPVQSGKPVAISLTAFELCCCCGGCLKITYNQHRQALGQGTVDCPTAAEMQIWLEAYCTSFVDSTTEQAQVNETGDGLLMYTKSTWAAKAGIDILHWHDEDMAGGFKALKWTQVGAGTTDAQIRGGGNVEYYSEDESLCKAKAVSNWNSTPWTSTWYAPKKYTNCYRFYYYDQPGVLASISSTIRSFKLAAGTTDDCVTKNIELWVQGVGLGDNAPTYPIVFFNHGDPVVEGFALQESISGVSGSIDVNFAAFMSTAMPTFAPDSPLPYELPSSRPYGYELGTVTILVKWNFIECES